jgi:cytochrome b pre-mRNA-processing protein 3
MVVIHLFVVLERLRAVADAASPLPRLMVEAFIADMDDSLREMGTGDLAVPRKVRRAATGLYERSMAYKTALEHGDLDALTAVLREHVYGDATAPSARALADYISAASAAMAATNADRMMDGEFAFPGVSLAAAEAK